jgi:hypothetical protein
MIRHAACGLAAALLLATSAVASTITLSTTPFKDAPDLRFTPSQAYLSTDFRTGTVLIWQRGYHVPEGAQESEQKAWPFALPGSVVFDRPTTDLWYRPGDGSEVRIARGDVDILFPPGAAFFLEPGVEVEVSDDWRVTLTFETDGLRVREQAAD